jgi:hypothetical protein
MFEHYREPLIPGRHFVLRLFRHLLIAIALVFAALALGAFGYHYTENLPWIDSVLNASMILTGMGPVNTMQTNFGKLFATFYALFSGVVFLTLAAVLFAPALHRFLHKFHLEFDETDSKD